MSHMGGKVTWLQPPPGMDAAAARGLLKKDLPGDQFALNQIYSLYQPANQPAAVKDMATQAQRTQPAHPASASMCQNDHCFGREVIKWQDYLLPCANDVRIGVIDTSVDHAHPAFSHARLDVGDFIPEDRMPSPSWHGTGVVALLAGDTESGTPGLVPHAKFYVANVFFSDSAGQVATDTSSLLRALEWMDAQDVKIVNMSFSGPKDELVQKSIERMSARGVIFVAAAGNDGPTAAPNYPAAYKPVIAVTAVTKELRNYPYANRGAQIDVAAPGVDIWTAVPNGREGYHSGTSFAAPYVTAVLATIIKDLPRAQKDQLLEQLSIVDLGPPGRDPIYGRGLLTAPQSCNRPDGAIATAPAGPGILPQVQPASAGARVSPPPQAASFR